MNIRRFACFTRPTAPPITLSTYIVRRLGRDARSQSINFLAKPFGAASFSKFWWYWNPVFGYYLYYYSYNPLRKSLPRWLAVWITFLFCGMIHDIPFGIAAVLSGKHPPQFTITTMFALLGMVVIVSEWAKLTFRRFPNGLRWGIHALTIFLCWRVALYLTTGD